MILSKTPLRLGFMGGGSDLPAFYKQEMGAVVNMAINKYIYIAVNKKYDGNIRVSYSRTEDVSHLELIENELVRESLKMLNYKGGGIEIVSIADIPKGTGLGSSGSFTVGVLHALARFQGMQPSPGWLAENASSVEIHRCKRSCGKQDQYIAAYGGLRYIEFHSNGTVEIEYVTVPMGVFRQLDMNLVLMSTGIERSSEEILIEQSESLALDNTKQEIMKRMVLQAKTAKTLLQEGKVDEFGELLHEAWTCKREMATNISNPQIDEWYELARKNGALGGKITGAGGGGFFVFYVPCDEDEENKKLDKFVDVMEAAGLKHEPFRAEREGSQVRIV